jgi:hypothetical protein
LTVDDAAPAAEDAGEGAAATGGTPDEPPRAAVRTRGRRTDGELLTDFKKTCGNKRFREMLRTPSGREFLGLKDVAFDPPTLPADQQHELTESSREATFARRLKVGKYAFAAVVHLVVFAFAAWYCWHNEKVSLDRNRTPEERKQAEANIEKVVTGLIGYASGTVAGYVFKEAAASDKKPG